MTASWPGGLSNKKLAVSGYSEDVYSDPTIRSQNDSGPPKARSRFTFVPEKIVGNISTLSSAEVDTLKTFWNTTCVMGSLPFTWTHPRTTSAVTFMWMKYPVISPADGSPITFNATLELLIIG